MDNNDYTLQNEKTIYFITLTVQEWVDVFTKKEYRDIVVNALRYSQLKQGLILHAWCILGSQVLLLASASNDDLADLLTDIKKNTTTQITDAIVANDLEKRKKWMLTIFHSVGKKTHPPKYFFWRQDNQSTICFSPGFALHKVKYIHNCPVEAAIVVKPEEYVYSSAKAYYTHDVPLLEVEMLQYV